MNNKQLLKLIPLLLQDPISLNDEQISFLLEKSKDIEDVLFNLWCSFSRSLKEVQKCRAREKELANLSPEKFSIIRDSVWHDGSTAHEAGFHEPPPFGSDRYIVHKILQERLQAEFPK